MWINWVALCGGDFENNTIGLFLCSCCVHVMDFD